MRENAAALLELLEDSVRLELMSDVPLGVMLSGGLDSSLLAALMSRNLSDPVQTFSVGFAEDAQSSELDDARAVASAIGATHHELKLSIDEVELDLGGAALAPRRADRRSLDAGLPRALQARGGACDGRSLRTGA